MKIDPYLLQALLKLIEMRGQDLFLKIASVPRARIGGTLHPLPLEPAQEEHIQCIINEVLNPIQKELLERNRSVDFSFSIPGDSGRFRGNIFYQQGVCSVVIRRLWKSLPSFEELHIPTVLKSVAVQKSGIILLAGTVASGKTTTINAMIDHMNTHAKRHIITIEDPIEYLHDDKECVINQREIGQDAHDFNSALRYVVRQSPDVVMIGEMRDADTVNFALSASEVGRLVISTVHAKSVSQIFGRVLGFYPAEQRDHVLNHLSYHINCFVVQKLLVRKDGKTLVPSFEIMVGTSLIRQLVRNKEFTKIPQALINGARDGMCTMDQTIFSLWEEEEITTEEALGACEKPMELEKRMKGINVSGQGASILGS